MATPVRAATPHPGRWPAGAWFGCQVGGTCWLLTGAAEMAQASPPLAGLWASLFVVSNGLGTWLWRRHRLGRPVAARLMLLTCSVAGLTALVALDAARPVGVGGSGVPAVAYLLVLAVPAVVAGLAATPRFAAARRAA